MNQANPRGVEDLTFSEDTLKKVYEALLENGIFGPKATDVVSAMQNRGILFREARKGVRGRPRGSSNRTSAKAAEYNAAVEEAQKRGEAIPTRTAFEKNQEFLGVKAEAPGNE